ncbi:DUF485 domain-containing protein [Streptomyces sp. NPDC046261]|uniref:DUF485 domain-containing protein n=1 Tax=Streptomyces sp. NPDC046261 TaxID=3157200 RepID=UPI0033C2049C
MDSEEAVGTTPSTARGPEEPVRPAIPAQPEHFAAVHDSAEFAELRRAHRSFAFPLTIAFVTWYLLYVLLSNYAGAFMDTTVVGNINIAFVFGLAQFLTTFLIAWWYAKHAETKIDPKAEALKARMEAGE